jgi:uncharacterized membrane protein
MCDPQTISEGTLKVDDTERLKWAIEQFRALAEERRAFDRYMWQLPVGSLGIVALLLNAASTSLESQPPPLGLVKASFFVSSVICVYSAMLLARLHARRSLREMLMKDLEGRVWSFSMVTSSPQVDEMLWRTCPKIQALLASATTTALGICVLVIVALITMAIGIFCV